MAMKKGCHSIAIRVRYAETDKMGIAHNSQYLTWFEIGRTEFLRECGIIYKALENIGLRLPVVETGVKYLKPVCYDDVITIRSFLARKPGLRLRINYEIWRDTTLTSTGFTEHVFTDKNIMPKKPPRKLLNNLIELWEKNRFPSHKE